MPRVKKSPSPHIRESYSTKIRDYNGVGRWSVAEVQKRYLEHCKRLKIKNPQIPQPMETAEGDGHWIYPIMYAVIEGIKRGDKACLVLGIEFIEEDDFFVFGRILKANTAKALRQAELTDDHIARVRKRIVEMLLAGNVPWEFREYAKLLRHIGIGDGRTQIEEGLPAANPYVRRYINYLLTNQPLAPAIRT
ncbi:MAG TPA: hypothetical protein VK737_07815 [Opitutales bacterium]|jgi:hypothetical protein|nr:hypothetical protein [Opitutales bacterium]